MFRIFLAAVLLFYANAQMTNVDDSKSIQGKFGNLWMATEDIKDEIKLYFMGVGSPTDWHSANYQDVQENIGLLGVLHENISSTSIVAEHTLQYQASEAELYFQSERGRAEAVGGRLSALARRAAASEEALGAERGQLAEARGRVGRADEAMNAAQARLLGLRRGLDALLSRFGQLHFRLDELLAAQRKIKVQADAMFEGKKEAMRNVEDVKTRTKATENAIKQIRSEMQALKARSEGAASESRSSVSATGEAVINYIKSVKTASGKGKRIRLVLLSD